MRLPRHESRECGIIALVVILLLARGRGHEQERHQRERAEADETPVHRGDVRVALPLGSAVGTRVPREGSVQAQRLVGTFGPQT